MLNKIWLAFCFRLDRGVSLIAAIVFLLVQSYVMWREKCREVRARRNVLTVNKSAVALSMSAAEAAELHPLLFTISEYDQRLV